MRRVIVLAVLLALITGPVAVTAQDKPATPRLESLVPADSFFFASFNDVAGMRAQCSRTAMAKLFHEPEVQKFLAPAMKEIEKHLKMAEAQAGHPVFSILNSIKGQAAVAVVSYDPLYGGLIPDAAIMVDLGDGRAEFQKIHDQALAKAEGKVGIQLKEHAGVPFQIVTLPMGIDLSISYLGDALLVTTMTERMREMIDASQGKLEKSLAANQTFNVTREHTGKDAFFSAFLNVESIFAHYGDRLPPMATQIMGKLAIDSMKGIGFGSSFAGEGIRESFFAYVPGEKKGLMKLFYSDPGNGMELLDRVPRNAFYAAAGRADVEKMYAEALQLVGDIDPNVLEQVMGGIYQAEEFIGLRIREDLLAPLGNQMAAYAAMPGNGGLIPDLVMMVKLDQPEKFEQTLVHMVNRGKEMMAGDRRLTMELRNLDYAGAKIHYIHVSEKWGDPVAVTPSYVRNGDLAYFSLYPQVLKDLAARKFAGPSIKENPDFARALKGLPADMASVEYMDFGAVVRILYGTIVPVAQLAAKRADIPVDMALLPRTETVAKHFFGGIWGVKLEEDGIAFHASTPVGVVPTMFVAAAPLFFLASAPQAHSVEIVAAPAMGNDEAAPAPLRHPAPAAPARPVGSAESRLEEIYVALLWHYADKGAYPADLAALVTTGALENAASLVLAGDDKPLDLGGTKSSFAYLGAAIGELREGRENAVWIYSRDNLGGGHRWVLFADGTRKKVAEADFVKLLTGTKARLKK